MKCFYHIDLDGKAAAFCVYTWVGIKAINQSVEFIPIDYNMPFPFDTIQPNEQVWIVDYSIEPQEMTRLLDITKDVTWIDHHKTAIDKYSGYPHEIRGIRKDGEAGCVLTWKYIHWWTERGEGAELFDRTREDILPVPKCIILTGDRDIWAWKYGDVTKHFYSGSQLYNTEPGFPSFWFDCMAHETEPLEGTGNAAYREKGLKFWSKLLLQGETIEKYKQQFYGELAESIGYKVLFEDYSCYAVNVARISSDVFGSLMEQYDILLPHFHNGTKWTVSLYSKSVDVSEIAKRYGGGGHVKASGFQCKELPWLIETPLS